MGLTNAGFIPESLSGITGRVEARLEQYNPGFDFSPESPDGQMINIMAAELALAWDELNNLYNSYNPLVASGQALRNIAAITGIAYQAATRSTATVALGGITGTLVPRGSLVSDLDGNVFYTNVDATIPSDVDVIASTAGPIPITAGTIVNIDSSVSGWETVVQSADGTIGETPQSEQQYRNLRNRTVMRNAKSVEDALEAKLVELGVSQIYIINNDSGVTAPDGTPAYTIHVMIGEQGTATDAQIAETIYLSKGFGVSTYGSSANIVTDSKGIDHTIYFTKATQVPIYINMDITFLSDNSVGAEDDIKAALISHIDSLAVGEAVVWSRLFTYITPYGKAQVNSLTIGTDLGSMGTTNLVMSISETASLIASNIAITVS